MKMVLVGVATTGSGYGSLTRDIYNFLKASGVDISVRNIASFESQVEFDFEPYKDEDEYDVLLYSYTHFDMSGDRALQQNLAGLKAKKRILITAGIETDIVTSEWNTTANKYFDSIVVSAAHGKAAFEAQHNPDIAIPIYVATEGVDLAAFYRDESSELTFSTPKNFLVSGQIGLGKVGEDRKQIWETVDIFCNTFRDVKDIGLILKVWLRSYCSMEENYIRSSLAAIRGNSKYPKLHLVYGATDIAFMRKLYSHPSVRAYMTLSSGEGFGRGMIEAAACKTPLICPNVTGQKDFLLSDCIHEVAADLVAVPDVYKKTVPCFMALESKWYKSRHTSVMKAMRECCETDRASDDDKVERLYASIAEHHSFDVAAKQLLEAIEKTCSSSTESK